MNLCSEREETKEVNLASWAGQRGCISQNQEAKLPGLVSCLSQQGQGLCGGLAKDRNPGKLGWDGHKAASGGLFPSN